MNLKERFPKLLSKIDEELDELRYLIVVDENYDDDDTDEFDVFNPEDYSHIVYIDERVQNVLGEDGMSRLIETLDNDPTFSEFIAGEVDNYGVQSSMNEDEIAEYIVNLIEEKIV
jgi:hypothetical protein